MLPFDGMASLLGTKTVNQDQAADHDAVVKRKWTLLIVSFVIITIIGFSYVWSLPPVFQTEAKIGLNDDSLSRTTNSVSLLAQFGEIKQQIQRYSLLAKVRDQLNNKYAYGTNQAELSSNLTVLPDLASRTVTIRFQSDNPEQVKASLDELLDVFFTEHNQTLSDANSDELSSLETQLVNLDAQIQAKRIELEQLAQANQIVSFERDENQIIALLKSTTDKLNVSIGLVDEGKDILAKIQLAKDAGTPLMHPEDQQQVAALKSSIAALDTELSALSRQYTEAYLALDPVIVDKKQKLEAQQLQLAQLTVESAQRYQHESELQLALDEKNVVSLQARIDEINDEARKFNFQLQTYNRLTENVSELESQREFVAQQITSKQLSQALQLVLEEPAYLPDAPIGPSYALYSLYALVIACLGSIGILVLYTYITRAPQTASVNNVTLVPQTNNALENRVIDGHYNSVTQRLAQPPQAVEQLTAPVTFMILTAPQIQVLYSASNELTKCIILLAMSGVTEDEFNQFLASNIDGQQGQISLSSGRQRYVSLMLYGEFGMTLIVNHIDKLRELSKETINHALVNSAYDAKLDAPEQINFQILRNTFMAFLVSNGMRINQLEEVVGFVPPQWLAPLRQYIDAERATLASPIPYPLTE